MVKAVGSLFTLAGETLSAIGRMIERPAFNDEAAEQFLGGRWESDGPDAADSLADFEERIEVHEPPLIFRSSTAATPPRLVDRREPPATPSVVEAPGTQSSECPGCSDFACPGPHTSPGASSVSQPAAAAVPGEAVGAVESSSGDGADWPLGELLKESGRLLWAYGIGEASEYTMHLAMQLRTAALRISDTE
jgi:hypothetical protein